MCIRDRLETLYFPERSVDEPSARRVDLASSVDQLPAGVKRLVQDNMSNEEIRQAATSLSSAEMTPEQRKALIRKRLQDLRNRARAKRQ